MSSISSTSRDAAISKVRAALGLTNLHPGDWTHDQRLAYNAALSAEIIRRSADFPAAEVAVARQINANPTPRLEDAGFDFGMLATETLRPITDAAQSVGDGALSVANMSRWLLPLAALAFVVIFFTGHARRSGAIK